MLGWVSNGNHSPAHRQERSFRQKRMSAGPVRELIENASGSSP